MSGIIFNGAQSRRYVPILTPINQMIRPVYRIGGKRALDILLAIPLFIVALPLMLALSIIVSLDGGNPIFSQTRVGRGGRPFSCYKIRSMVANAQERLQEHLANDPEAAEEWQRDRKLTNDPRITAVGRFIRKTSLDELPQLWNVLRGDMSLVGPRPVVPDELPLYGSDVRHYKSVPPGLTGLWQVSGRNDVSYEERVRMDVYYSRSVSLLGDLLILLMTGMVVVQRTGR